MDSVDDMMSSKIPVANFTVTYVQFIRVAKVIIKHGDMLPLLPNLGRNAPMPKTIDIVLLGDPGTHSSSKEDSLFMI